MKLNSVALVALSTVMTFLSAGCAHFGDSAPPITTFTPTTPTGPATTTTAPASRPVVVSPQINPDGTVTFRFLATKAKAVECWGDWPKPNGGPCTQSTDGIWSATFGPITPGIYGYSFKVDGEYVLDRSNPISKPSRTVNTSVLHIPGNPPLWWDRQPGVAHGTVRLHEYDSTALGRTRKLRVYTPAGYDADSTTKYPVFYLLHGSGDNEAVWTDYGRAHVIVDNLIAAGKARPMIVVMTDGHATSGFDPASRQANTEAFAKDFLQDVMPFVESTYRIEKDRNRRAIMGLSMGGNQSLIIGLLHPELFAFVGGMSSAIRDPERDLGANFATKSDLPQSVQLYCGTEDFLLKENRHFDAFLTERKVDHNYAESPGGHTWTFWRNGLPEFTPGLFHNSK